MFYLKYKFIFSFSTQLHCYVSEAPSVILIFLYSVFDNEHFVKSDDMLKIHFKTV